MEMAVSQAVEKSYEVGYDVQKGDMSELRPCNTSTVLIDKSFGQPIL